MASYLKYYLLELRSLKEHQIRGGGRKYSAPDSNVDIEHIPKKPEGFKGGDYIDYEEVK